MARLLESLNDQRNPRKQSEQERRGACNGVVRPLALACDPQMTPGFLQGHLHAPACHKAGDNPLRIPLRIGA